MKEKFFCRCFVLLMALAAFTDAPAQEAVKKGEPAMGSVAGTATCGDTNAPARFAVVTLEPVPAEGTAESAKTVQQTSSVIATTDLDGRFAMDRVPPGKYLVLARLAGYLNPLAGYGQEELKKMSADTRKDLLAQIPTVTVDANQAATVNLRLEHAAAVSGTVLYDDGSPAVGLQVQVIRKRKDGAMDEINWDLANGLQSFVELFGALGTTDDRGHYQMIGLPPGEYAVMATLPIMQISAGGVSGGKGTSLSINMHQGNALSVYSGDVFRKRDAKFQKIGIGEMAGGMDIAIPLNGLHAVRGTVTAKRDGHALNKGKVDLLYADDRQEARTAEVEKDGSFEFGYVPEGKYILRVQHGADAEEVQMHQFNSNYTDERIAQRYADAELPLLVQGDVSGLELAAPNAATSSVAQQ